MKTGIADYFGQSPKGISNDGDEVPSLLKTGDSSKKPAASEPSTSSNSEDATLNGKENLKEKRKGKVKKCSEKAQVPLSDSSIKKKSQKKKSLSTKKVTEIENSDCVSKASGDADSQPPNFSLKIKMKSKQQNDGECFIEEFSSPERADNDNRCSDLRSPQGTLLQYFSAQKTLSSAQKESDSKVKANKDITDFFSPSKQKEVSPATPNKRNIDKKEAGNESVVVGEVVNEKGKTVNSSSKSKFVKKTKKKSLSAKIKEGEDAVLAIPLAENTVDLKVKSPKRDSKSRVKSKHLKRSLSLPKTDGTAIKPSIQVNDKKQENENEILIPSAVVQSISNNLKHIMSKSPSIKITETKSGSTMEPLSITSKKRKRVEDADSESVGQSKPSKSACDDSPVKSRRRFSKNNCINCDSDDETSSKLNEQKSGELSLNTHINNSTTACGTDVPCKGDDSKRNSLMNYFSKVSREELLSKEEKIEYKVQALVHSPPTTPSKKGKRRSIHSLPGGASSLTKRKGKAKLKENLNAIDVINVDETKGSNLNSKDQSLLQASGLRQGSTPKNSNKSQKIHTSPQKKISDSPSINLDISQNSRESVSNPKTKSRKSVSHDNVVKAGKCVSVVSEESLAVPLTVTHDKSGTESSPGTQHGWKLRVCLTPVSLPSTQGTLLEDDSDCDEIFKSRSTKKRRLVKQNNENTSNDKTENEIFIISQKEESLSPDVVFEKQTGLSVKIAPLFTRKAETQARQLFLQSGVPDQVKRAVETQQSFEEQEAEIFPTKSHIQQITDKDWVWNLVPVDIPFKTDFTGEIPITLSNFSLSEMTGCCNIMEEVAKIMDASCKGPEMRTIFGLPIDIVKPILRLIKQESPDFKTVNTFIALRSKLREEEMAKAAALSTLSEIQRPKRKSSNRKSSNSKDLFTFPTYRAQVWTEKYRPVSANEIVGNKESLQQLKQWLEAWRKASEDTSRQSNKDDMKRKKKRKDLIDDDEDFLVSDNSSQGGHSNLPVGVAVLYGPNGSGKTSSVYALAKDLGYKVLEVNASEKRNGKLVLSKLSEATQSHQVQQGNNAEQGFAALFGNKNNKLKSNKQKPSVIQKSNKESEEEKAKKMSLILFEDVDVVFDEEDEGFLSAISSLVSTSKRPVILTTTDPESPTISRFMNSASLILQYSISQNMLSTWLQIVSLLEGVYAAPDAVKDLVLLCKGDFRRALLQMQLWVISGGNNLPTTPLMFPRNGHKPKKGSKTGTVINDSDMDDMNDDETVNTEDLDSKPAIPANPDCISVMLGLNSVQQQNEASDDSRKEKLSVKIPFPLNLGSYWWNIPPLLSLKQVGHAPLPVVKEVVSNSGVRRMLDDSFIASFCTEDGDMSDCGTNEESDTCSQGTTTGGSQKEESIEPSGSKTGEVSHAYRSFCSQREMFAISSQMVCLSSVDVIFAPYQLAHPSNEEPISRFPHAIMKDSLSLVKFEEEGCCYVSKSTTEEICHWLAEQSLTQARNELDLEGSCLHSCYNPCLPKEDELRWRDAHAQTKQAALAAVPLSMHLERQAISTDYVPTLRTLCRLERNRSIINTKRRNRFYHYLRSIGTSLTDSQLEILCYAMSD